MQLYILLAFSGLASAAAAPSCNANNCLRQVRGSSFPTRSGAADCSRFQTTSSTVYTTTTVTGTANVTPTPPPTMAPATIPAYASGCSSDTASYRSACSCNGQTSTVFTTTSTLTATTSVPVAACNTYIISGPTTGKYAGTHLAVNSNKVVVFNDNGGAPQSFGFSSGVFYAAGTPTNSLVADPTPNSAQPDRLDLTVDRSNTDQYTLRCSITGTAISCTADGGLDNTFFYADNDVVIFGDPGDAQDPATSFVPQATPACG